MSFVSTVEKAIEPVISATLIQAESGNASEAITESLIQRCIKNERQAQQELYKTYYGRMMAMCRRYITSKDDAMEVLNQGFLKVFQSLQQYRNDGPFEGWIYRIIYRTVIDHLRSKTRKKEMSLEDEDVDVGVNPDAMHRLQAADLFRLLDRLPETTRAVFNMFAIEGYKHAEIAEMLNMTEGTSKWHVNNARKILKDLIDKHI